MQGSFSYLGLGGVLGGLGAFYPPSEYRYLKGEHRSTESQEKSYVFCNITSNLQLVELGETTLTKFWIYSP